jgi:hypothetical protein
MMKTIPTAFFIAPLLLLNTTQVGNSLPVRQSWSLDKQLSVLAATRSGSQNILIAKDDFALMGKERLGSLRIGLPERKVKQAVNCKVTREPERLWGADGAYHQTWKYAACGISLDMVSEKAGEPKSIASITLTKPSLLSTTRGIRLGSTAKAVMKAYQTEWNKDSSNSDSFVAGSIYGGLIFNFQNGKVSKIFLGAAAE